MMDFEEIERQANEIVAKMKDRKLRKKEETLEEKIQNKYGWDIKTFITEKCDMYYYQR